MKRQKYDEAVKFLKNYEWNHRKPAHLRPQVDTAERAPKANRRSQKPVWVKELERDQALKRKIANLRTKSTLASLDQILFLELQKPVLDKRQRQIKELRADESRAARGWREAKEWREERHRNFTPKVMRRRKSSNGNENGELT